MEITGNKYLHKKFKKQSNCSPIYNVEDKNDNVLVPVVNNGQCGEIDAQKLPIEGHRGAIGGASDNKKPVNFLLFKDNNYVGSVPNFKSTNNYDSSLVVNGRSSSELANVTVDNQSSISKVAVSVNVAKSCSSVVPKEPVECYNKYRVSDQTNMVVRPNDTNFVKTSNVTSCISTITTTLANELKENIIRNFSFDTKLISEPSTSKTDKSSIFDTNYSKYSVISERPIDEAKLYTTDGAQQEVTTEKKPNGSEPTGGKYVCTYCNLACSKPSVLQKHIRAHTNERPYPCVSCGFSFKTRSNLYKHCRSRTHANRVMGNKHVQAAGPIEPMDIDSSSEKNEDDYIEDKPTNDKLPTTPNIDYDQIKVREQKPYKPRFHTANIFFEETKLKENDSAHFTSPDTPNIRANPDILKLRINELIHKNNSIMNCDDAVVIRKRNVEPTEPEYLSQQVVHWQQPDYKNPTDEPLNLTAKNRKRCLSDSDNTQKSLIKELLLKNLSTDPNLQCPYCKMIFQTVTELEMHKLKYCNAKTSNIRYARSSSVNVASILTQNKNAFDNIPHMQHTTFPLKSPGPCLGKTRLIENERQAEKYRTFSFDDNVILHHTQSDSPSFNKYMLQSAVGTYPLSPQIKKNPIRLFGGEVKITQTSGETRSFKIESESINKMQEEPQNFMEFSANLSENLVIKSGLHSGGTVLQNKANYSPKTDSLPSPNIIRMYDNADLVSPSLNLQLRNDKPKFTFEPNEKLLQIANNTNRGFFCRDTPETNYNDSDKDTELYKSNLIDFGQKACKLLAPNLKTPNLKVTGLPIPLATTPTVTMAPLEINTSQIDNDPIDKQHLENLNFAKKQISLQQRMAEVPQPQHAYNPMNLFVNGKVIPYVPGIPGPVAPDLIYNPIAISARSKHSEPKDKIVNGNSYERKTPTIFVDCADNLPYFETKSMSNRSFSTKPIDAISRISETKTTPSATVSSAVEESRRFVRPTSLALKPTSGAFKSHHGLTPTMFNQALISPDTPRVAKKYCQQYLNGNYFSYLGLKSSTKSVYCTLNKTQPFYVKHFKKLSMYSEWRQQESKIDSLNVSAYDYRQRQHKYTMAGTAKADLVAHSSYKFVKSESSSIKEDPLNKSNSVFGGYESNEDYTYIRGRGRGRYVCEQCGIRCKKPSMLKKHIRTHSDDRPYTCEHCNFSFKTKGNLTKHMKSKAHTKKYAATSSTSTHNSTSSDTDESDGESSDESTRLQEHEAAHCLLSLAHKNNQHIQDTNSSISSTFPSSSTTISRFSLDELKDFSTPDKITNTNFSKIKSLDESNASKPEVFDTPNDMNVSQYLGKSGQMRPLTYPYLQTHFDVETTKSSDTDYIPKELPTPVIKHTDKFGLINRDSVNFETIFSAKRAEMNEGVLPTNTVYRKRKLSSSSSHYKIQRTDTVDSIPKAVDLRIPIQNSPVLDLSPAATFSDTFNGRIEHTDKLVHRTFVLNHENQITHVNQPLELVSSSSDQLYQNDRISEPLIVFSTQKPRHNSFSESNSSETFSQNSDTNDRIIGKMVDLPENSLSSSEKSNVRGDRSRSKSPDYTDQDQSAMQTLAEIAIKQVKLEKNILAKNVASEYLKLALNCDGNNLDGGLKKFAGGKETGNELMVKPEENKNCSICSKNFSKPSQLRLHMNIHYLERPFRCESCSVSFRTKGHLQKHERSASHQNKLSTSPALSSSEPRPFKCSDCNIAFRIHGHLAKHLRSKMHIMKLECLAKIPFGLYAELERANSLLTEINTTDGDLCLESLKILAKKLFNNDPNKLDQLVNQTDLKMVSFQDS